jgi:FkbM family methyltransferase
MSRWTRSLRGIPVAGRLFSGFVRVALWRPPPRYRSTAIGIELLSGDQSLHLVSKERLIFYRQGLRSRLAQVASEYGVPEFVTVRPTDVVVDVGANIGEFAILCTHAGAMVYALEPDINAFLCLARNVAGRNVVPLNIAAWEEDRLERLHMATGSADSSLINPTNDSRPVLALRLDTFAQLSGVGRVRLLKADVEGAEPEVLRGAESLLARTEYVSFDCGPERGGESTLRECEQILVQAGFSVIRREEAGRNNLVARNDSIEAQA